MRRVSESQVVKKRAALSSAAGCQCQRRHLFSPSSLVLPCASVSRNTCAEPESWAQWTEAEMYVLLKVWQDHLGHLCHRPCSFLFGLAKLDWTWVPVVQLQQIV